MLGTSETYQALLQDLTHHKEYRLDIEADSYTYPDILSLSTHHRLYADDTVSIGGAVSAELDVTLSHVKSEPPICARMQVYVRLASRDGRTVSEWLPHGVFFIDTRASNYVTGTLTIHGYDVMMLGEKEWVPDQSLVFPLAMSRAAEIMAGLLGTELDPRCSFADYTIGYPANGITIRGILQEIAAAHGGNWIVTYEGKLLLIAIDSYPDETWYLISEYGRPLNFGGKVIWVE